jgi:hypothetical protein
MLGERNMLERFTVQGKEEDNRWGTKGYKYTQIQNSNGYISKFGTSEKNLGFPTSEISTDCSPYGRNLRDKTRNLRTRKQQGQNSSRSLSFGCVLGFRKDRL